MVIGTDLFESVRVDRQLKGRSGRQGNPGTSVFFASLEDQILKNLSPQDQLLLEKTASTLPEGEMHDEQIRCFFKKAQSERENYFKKRRKETARKDDIVAPHRKKFYEQRNAVLFSADVADSIVRSIIFQSNASESIINNHLSFLYQKTKELVVRSRRNNPNGITVFVPFSDKLHTFAILLEVELTIASFEYFCKEFKRQIILHVYDKEWKKFVLHMMSNLDKKEIEMLDGKYLMMMNEINSIILSRLQYSTIPFEIRMKEKVGKTYNDSNPNRQRLRRSSKIGPDDTCPCGSGKKYCECHGNNTRSNSGMKIRR